jgi:poly(3-hydroxyalkanoate) synthetase
MFTDGSDVSEEQLGSTFSEVGPVQNVEKIVNIQREVCDYRELSLLQSQAQNSPKMVFDGMLNSPFFYKSMLHALEGLFRSFVPVVRPTSQGGRDRLY